jgi:putative sigma-54 modulation protein
LPARIGPTGALVDNNRLFTKDPAMNLTLTGHHLDISPAIRAYVEEKIDRVNRHFDHVIDVTVVLCVEKLVHKAEANVHVSGKDLHAEATDQDMYAAIDALADKLDRMVVKHKEMQTSHRAENGGAKRAAESNAGGPR